MADTGFIRHPDIAVIIGTVINQLNLRSGSNGNTQIVGSNTRYVQSPLNETVLDPYIDTVAGEITGISFKVDAKNITTGDGISVALTDGGFNSLNEFNLIPDSSDFTTLEFGEENSTWGFSEEEKKIVFDWDNLSLWRVLYSVTSSQSNVFIKGSDEDLTPSVKIYYTPLTKQVTGWKRFKTLDDSGGFTSGDVNDLTSGSTGEASSLNSATPPYFILSDPEDFNIPPNAVIEGLEVKTVIKTSQNSELSSNQIWKIKVDTQPVSESDITNPYLSIPPMDVDSGQDRTIRSFRSGSETNLFGLNLTPGNLQNLRIGIKCTDLGLGGIFNQVNVYGSGEDGIDSQRKPNPSIRVFYSVPSKPPHPTKKSLATATIEVKATQPVSQLVNLTSNLSPQGSTSLPIQGSLEETQEATAKAAQSTFNTPVEGADRDSETGLTNTDNAPLFTRRRFSPL